MKVSIELVEVQGSLHLKDRKFWVDELVLNRKQKKGC